MYTNQQGETITSTEWHNIVLWRSLAEIAEKSVKKGTQVYIVGKIKTRSYVDKDGNNKYITEILADTLMVLEKKQGAISASQEAELNENGNVRNYSTEGNKTVSGQNAGSSEKDNSVSGGSVSEPGTNYPFDDTPSSGKSEDDLPF
jgi:single-strand DNA-binding protein